jgi:hypothetical protein
MAKCLVCKVAIPDGSKFCTVWHAIEWRYVNMTKCQRCKKELRRGDAVKYPIMVEEDGRLYTKEINYCSEDCMCIDTAEMVVNGKGTL